MLSRIGKRQSNTKGKRMPAPRILFVSKEEFEKLLKEKLGDKFARATKLFDNYGPRLSAHFANACLFASEQTDEKLEEVLRILERHWNESLKYKHPEQKGTEHNPQVFIMFEKLFRNTLHLDLDKPTPSVS